MTCGTCGAEFVRKIAINTYGIFTSYRHTCFGTATQAVEPVDVMFQIPILTQGVTHWVN